MKAKAATLNKLLIDEVKAYESEFNAEISDEQRAEIAAGLEYYILEYLAEQIPEQLSNMK